MTISRNVVGLLVCVQNLRTVVNVSHANFFAIVNGTI
jgi:hypothetical protein